MKRVRHAMNTRCMREPDKDRDREMPATGYGYQDADYTAALQLAYEDRKKVAKSRMTVEPPLEQEEVGTSCLPRRYE